MKMYVFLADGFEEIEALATVDLLRRAGLETVTVSINSGAEVTGAHGVKVLADALLADTTVAADDWMIMPGGLPGATNLVDDITLTGMLKEHHANGGHMAAICASPAFVLGALGLLDGVNATCYPGCEGQAPDVKFSGKPVEVSDKIITGRGPGYTMQFALAIITAAAGEDVATRVADGLLLTEQH
ncbi:MAG: DJ-1/PfpI family protein [Muribaculaceae bacterium]|nr:DJ-1/PfpI family protein [Muribaculaceae bacterium]